MAAVRADNFVENNNFVKTLYQTGRQVQETELNEMEDNARVQDYRRGRVGIEDGVNGPISFAGGANQFTAGAVGMVLDGYAFDYPGAVVSGLTTPGADRTDVIYAELTETEVADPAPDGTLGETSRRRKIAVAIKVAEGPATMPATSGHPYANGTYRYQLGTMERLSGVASLAAVVPVWTMRVLPGPAIDEITRARAGAVERVYAGSANIIEGKTATLNFYDTVMTAATVGALPLSDTSDTLGGRGFVGRNGAHNSGVGSLLRAINGRPHFTVGDGVNSFGDYNGASGLRDLCVAFWTVFPGKALSVIVKRGAYAPTVAISLEGPLRVVGEGKTTGGTEISPTGITAPFFNNTGSSTNRWPLTLENLRLTMPTGAAFAVILGGTAGGAVPGGNLKIKDCRITGGCQVLDGLAGEINLDAEGSQFFPTVSAGRELVSIGTMSAAVTTITIGRLLARGCDFNTSSGDAVPLSVTALTLDGPLYVEGVDLLDCTFVTSNTTTNTPPIPVRGVVRFIDTAIGWVVVRSMRFIGGTVANSGAAGGTWWDYCPGLVDGTTGTQNYSAIEHLAFVRVEFNAAVDNAYTPFFRLKARAWGVATNSISTGTHVIFEKCVYRMNGKTAAQHPHDVDAANSERGLLQVCAESVEAYSCRMIGANAGCMVGAIAGTATLATNTLVHFRCHDKVGSSGNLGGKIVVDGWEWVDMTNTAGGGMYRPATLHYCESGVGSAEDGSISVSRYAAEMDGHSAKLLAYDNVWLSLASTGGIVTLRTARFEGDNYDRAASVLGRVVSVTDVSSENMNGSSGAEHSVEATGTQSAQLRNVVATTTAAGTGAGIRGIGGSAGVGTCSFEGCYVRGFGDVGATFGGGHVSFTGCRFVGNNGNTATDHQVADIGGPNADSVSVFGNSCETTGGALAEFGVQSTAYGSDTTALGTHTPGAAMLFNRANF